MYHIIRKMYVFLIYMHVRYLDTYIICIYINPYTDDRFTIALSVLSFSTHLYVRIIYEIHTNE